MVRILLVQPPIYDFNAFDLWVRPLGWLNLAALLEAAGAEVVLADALDRYQPAARGLPVRNHRMRRFGCGHYDSEDEEKPACLSFVPRKYKRFGLSRERFRNLLASLPRPDLVLTGCAMTYWYPGVIETISLVRSLWPGTPVGVAGIYAILCFDHAQSVLGADFVYGGHDLMRLAEIADDRTGGRLKLKEVHPERYHTPAYRLMSQSWSLPLQTSSGCVFRCSYCASHRLQPRFQQFPLADLVEMLIHSAREFGTTDWAFYDDVFAGECPGAFHAADASGGREGSFIQVSRPECAALPIDRPGNSRSDEGGGIRNDSAGTGIFAGASPEGFGGQSALEGLR
jgi:hypothetical protein